MRQSLMFGGGFVLLLLAGVAIAQPPTGNTGPGGFEATNVASGLNYWLRADAGVTLSGTNVSTWNSQSSGGLNFSQGTSSKQPLFTGVTIGGNLLAAIRFDGDLTGNSGGVAPNADELILNTSSSNRTVIIVNSVARHQGLDGIWGINNADTGLRRNSAAAWQSTAAGNANDFTFNGSMFINGTNTTSVGLNTPHILSGIAPANVTFGATSIGDYFQVGTNTPRPFTGDVGEMVVYNRALNLAERQIVENSLSARFDIALSSGDVYVGDTPVSGNFDKNVFGVGQVSAGNALAAAGQAGLGIQATAGLDDGDFILAGHRVDTNGTTALAGGIHVRSLRSWYVDGTALDGNEALTIAFDLSDAGLAPPTVKDPMLIFSPNDPNFNTYAVLANNPTISGDTYLFSLSPAAAAQFNANGFLTFAFAVPEPGTFLIWSLAGIAGVIGVARGRWRTRRPSRN